MYAVNTPDGEKFLVQLVGPSSYRMGNQITYRGGTLTVSKRTRDYLVRKTNGAWADFDPTPEEPIEEVMPPQFGEPGGPSIDMDDIDPEKNPPMSMEHAQQLAAMSGNIPEDVQTPDMADLNQTPTKPEPSMAGSGDMTGADLKQGQKVSGGGGKTAQAKAKPKPKPAAPKNTTIETVPSDEVATTIA